MLKKPNQKNKIPDLYLYSTTRGHHLFVLTPKGRPLERVRLKTTIALYTQNSHTRKLVVVSVKTFEPPFYFVALLWRHLLFFPLSMELRNSQRLCTPNSLWSTHVLRILLYRDPLGFQFLMCYWSP